MNELEQKLLARLLVLTEEERHLDDPSYLTRAYLELINAFRMRIEGERLAKIPIEASFPTN